MLLVGVTECVSVISDVTGGVNRGVHTRGNHVKSALGVLERTATEHGLNADDIITLLNVVTSSNKLRKL